MSEIEQKQYWTMKIRPHEKLWHIDFGEIWRYRDLIALFVRRNIVETDAQAALLQGCARVCEWCFRGAVQGGNVSAGRTVCEG